jgi:hypothetical protein
MKPIRPDGHSDAMEIAGRGIGGLSRTVASGGVLPTKELWPGDQLLTSRRLPVQGLSSL